MTRLAGQHELCDFTIISEDYKCLVHRLVISAHAKVLQRACIGDFTEASQRSIDLCEYPGHVLDALVEYMYNFDYKGSVAKHRSTHGLLAYHVQISILADKYDIQPLKKLASNKFKTAKLSINSRADLADAARWGYDFPTVTEDIREEIVRIAIQFSKIGLDARSKTDLDDVMVHHLELAVAIAKALSSTVIMGVANANPATVDAPFVCPQLDCDHRADRKIKDDGELYSCPGCGRWLPGCVWIKLGQAVRA